MKDINKMRLGVLRSLKELKHFISLIENGVKSRSPDKIYPAYQFLKTLCYHMNEGDLTPEAIELQQELLCSYNKSIEVIKNEENATTK